MESYKDGNSMAAAAEISERWRYFVERAIWAKPAILKQINYQGREEIARTTRAFSIFQI